MLDRHAFIPRIDDVRYGVLWVRHHDGLVVQMAVNVQVELALPFLGMLLDEDPAIHRNVRQQQTELREHPPGQDLLEVVGDLGILGVVMISDHQTLPAAHPSQMTPTTLSEVDIAQEVDDVLVSDD